MIKNQCDFPELEDLIDESANTKIGTYPQMIQLISILDALESCQL